LPLKNGTYRELFMAMTLIRLSALPRAPQLYAGLAEEGLIDVAGMGHGDYLCGGVLREL
jgi:hypothetical protein